MIKINTGDFIFLIRYSEIGLKGKNRFVFENKLIQNIHETFESFNLDCKIVKDRARLYVITKDNLDKAESALLKIAGIKTFSKAIVSDKNISSIINVTRILLSQFFKSEQNSISLKSKKSSKHIIKINVKRSDKSFPLISPEIVKAVATALDSGSSKTSNISNTLWTFDYKNYDLELGIEIQQKYAFVFLNKIKGIGGLPKGSSGKALLLLSGGIDSPVAAILGIKRGLSLNSLFLDVRNDDAYFSSLLHIFHRLKEFDPMMKLYTLPYYKYHLFVYNFLKNSRNLKYGCILCRRGMYYLAQRLSMQIDAKVLLTGENLGQVASQTLDNIVTTESIVSRIIFRPLLTYDKDEIFELAKQYRIDDVINLQTTAKCLILPKNPVTKSKEKELQKIEEKIGASKFLDSLFEELQVFD